jgi:hypothetical protein
MVRSTGTKRYALAPLLVLVSGCELQEVTLVESEDVVIAEVYVQVNEGGAEPSQIRAFLHRTLGPAGVGFRPVPGAGVTITREAGGTVELAETAQEDCVDTLPVDGDGTCYSGPPLAVGAIRPGERLGLEIRLADGGVLRSATTVPGDFSLVGVDPAGVCSLTPDTPFELAWTQSQGTWAYVNETSISGLSAALAAEGIEAEDPLYLLGLSISASDTTIVFPGEFGVFNRFELEQDLALRLQRGLPVGVSADVTITATDRNYVNWVRGGSFNPSGQVRLPSIQGDGTGVFASVLVRSLSVVVDPSSTTPGCPTF